MEHVLDQGDTDLVLQREGVGRLYYRIGMKSVVGVVVLKTFVYVSSCSSPLFFQLLQHHRTHLHPISPVCCDVRYAPSSLRVDTANYGFAVSRAYFGVASPDDAFQDDDGAWHLKLGAQIRVRVWMTATERRYHVALVDKLPAGLEPLVRLFKIRSRKRGGVGSPHP